VKTLRICYLSTGGGFLTVISEMAERGYSIEWKVYNSKDYGVPQNRERVYVVGYIGERYTRGLLPTKRESTTVIKQVGNLRETSSFGGNPQTGRVYSTRGIAPTINTCGGGDREPKILNAIPCLTPDREEKRQNGRRLKEDGEPAFTLTNQDRHGVLINKENKNGCQEISIRKLTPKECWRLQGFSDAQYEKVAAVNSNSQLYKQAGNAVTVNVVE